MGFMDFRGLCVGFRERIFEDPIALGTRALPVLVDAQMPEKLELLGVSLWCSLSL